ncbi:MULTISPECIES: hypothetical protein [Ramlibacter]|uniref:HTH luxR-type domain-containing protein n=1 Tax=Ramlibacter pinisoli TaxID=2682844 RepID=A0A6N8ISN6_9BURK|nr:MULTISPECIES: hypothetical protein [Ramlibacter]MBA2964882.1 hypothetical protein [Ramlibacter sp. CGMCC 1.13660]MVQ29847.1 hypothetical protein [Ramlibacter pinisoli]
MDEYERVIGRLYGAGLGEDSWDEALGAVARSIDACGHLIYELRGDNAGVDCVISEQGIGQEALERYFARFLPRNVWAANRSTMLPGAVVTSSMLYPDHLLKRTEYYADWLRHVQVFHAIGGMVAQDAESSTKITFVRPERRRTFDVDHRQTVERVFPHLRGALATRRRIARLESLLDPLRDAVDGLGQGLAIVGADGQVVHLNRCAQDLVDAGHPVAVRQGVLQFRDGRVQGQFLARLQAALAGPHPAADATFLVRQPPAPDLQCLVLPLPARVAGPRRAALFLSTSGAAGVPGPVLQSLYGLTAAEAALAVALGAGTMLEAHAAARGVSLHTVKSQLKAVLAKLGVHRQADVVRVVNRLLQPYGTTPH